MNDLNSIYLVGRIKSKPLIKQTKDNLKIDFIIVNNQYNYNEKTKEYKQETCNFNITTFSERKKPFISFLKKGIRVGLNGKIRIENKNIIIKAFNIQILDNEAVS